LLTGTLTGSRKRDESGDALIRERKERKAAVQTLRTEAERLAANRSADAVGVTRIKTSDAQRDLIISEGVTPLEARPAPRGRQADEPRCRGRNRRWRKSHLKILPKGTAWFAR
jgi:hypothetical protein